MKIPGISRKTEKGDPGNQGKRYLNTTYSLMRSARAWRWVSLIMAILVVVMAYQSIRATEAMPVRLVPYNFAVSQGETSIAKENADAQYLSLIATADIGLISNWTRKTIKAQYNRFLERTAPELFSQEQVALLNKAEGRSHGIDSQAFFQRDASVVGNNVVEVTGRLKRWQGKTLLKSQSVAYHIEYRFLHGVPYIHSFTRKEQ